MFARQRWIEASDFVNADDAAVLSAVERKVSERPGAVVILDLDSTLYEVKTRTFAILREWLATHGASPLAGAVGERLRNLEQHQVGYSLKDTLRAFSLDPDAPDVRDALEHLKTFWKDRFFTSAYLRHDVAYPGAARFAQRLHDAGALLVYLTGRDEPGMGQGTRERLVQDGFPVAPERTRLILKPNFHMEDMAHKENAARTVRGLGSVAASFENEPRNLVALHGAFPDALHVFVETDCSEQPAPAVKGLYRLRRWA